MRAAPLVLSDGSYCGTSVQPVETCGADSSQDPGSGQVRHQEPGNCHDDGREQREYRHGQRAVRGIHDAENQGDESVGVILLTVHMSTLHDYDRRFLC